MEISLRAWVRHLPRLGVAMVILALFGLTCFAFFPLPDVPGVHANFYPAQPILHATHLVLVGSLGILLIRKTRTAPPWPDASRLVRAAFVCLLFIEATRYLDLYAILLSDSVLQWLEVVGMALMSVPTAGLWGATSTVDALPNGDRSRRLARRFAILVLVGYGVHLIPEVFDLVKAGGFRFGRGSPMTALYYLLSAATRVLLFWSCIETVRPAASEEVVRQRTRKVHRLMACWFITGIALWTVNVIFWFMVGQGSTAFARLIWWRGLVYLTLVPAVALLLAVDLAHPAEKRTVPESSSVLGS